MKTFEFPDMPSGETGKKYSPEDRFPEADDAVQALDNLKNLDDAGCRQLALDLVEKGREDLLARNLTRFHDLDGTISEALIKAGYGKEAADHPKAFLGLDCDRFARLLLERGESDALAAHLDKLKGLSEDIALQLIDAGNSLVVAIRLDSFPGADRGRIANRLAEQKQYMALACRLDQFDKLDGKLAVLLMEEGYANDVAENLNRFEGPDCQTIARRFLKEGRYLSLVKYLKNFTGLDEEIALGLIKKDQISSVAACADSFSETGRATIVQTLLENDCLKELADNLDKFPTVDRKKLADRLIADNEVFALASNFDKFPALDPKTTAIELIGTRYGAKAVAEHLEKFGRLDAEVADLLILRDEGAKVAKHLDRFEGIDPVVIARSILEANSYGMGAKAVAANLGKFGRENQKRIADYFIETERFDALAEYLDQFDGLNHKALALELIEKDRCMPLICNIE
ncbi:MAG: hypothetical protein PHX61_07800 [Alphaproteobacteria bacterium]|nr:hypothetical protein [Alphaproteobacteria bacterium]